MSDGLFDQPKLVVSGYPWCKGETKVVGAAALTGKVLCRSHNSRLSPVDQEASSFFRQLSEAAQLHLERKALGQKVCWEPMHTVVDGKLLERWFLKTTINLSLAGRSDLKWHLSDTELTDVPKLFVDAAFGETVLPKPMGLYAVCALNTPQLSEEAVSFAPTLKTDSHIVGGTFSFRGLKYLLWLEDREVPRPPAPVMPRDWRHHQVAFHLAGMDFTVGGRESHAITYIW